MHCFAFNCLSWLVWLLSAHKTFSGYLLLALLPSPTTATALLSIGGDSLAAPLVQHSAPLPLRTPACSYYRNRICQIEVEMLSAFPCHLASVYRLIVCLPVCLFVRQPPSHSLAVAACSFGNFHSQLVSFMDSVSDCDSVSASVSLSG